MTCHTSAHSFVLFRDAAMSVSPGMIDPFLFLMIFSALRVQVSCPDVSVQHGCEYNLLYIPKQSKVVVGASILEGMASDSTTFIYLQAFDKHTSTHKFVQNSSIQPTTDKLSH